MNEKCKPFIINSNLCFENKDIASFDQYMQSTQFNIGNSYISYSLIKEICGEFKKVPHIQNIYYYDFSNVNRDIDFINSECSHVFFVIQDFIRIEEFPLPYEQLLSMFKKINKPLIVVGIGANAFSGFDKNLHKKLKPIVVKFLKYLSERCVQIGVRGYYTQEVLSNLGINNAAPIGCPSFYEMGLNRYVNKKNIDANYYCENENPILISGGFANKYLLNSYQICQDFQETNIIKAIAFNDFNSPFTNYQLDKIFDHKYRAFSSIKDWQNFVSKFKLTIGHRVHGAIISVNAGVPAICLNSDARAAEMCALLHIPVHKNVKYDTDILKIYETIDVDAMNNSYPALYQQYVELLRKNGIEVPNMTNDNNTQNDIQPHLKLYQNFKNSETWELQMRIKAVNAKLYVIESKLKPQNKVSLLEKIFSIKNQNNHKIIKFLGIKLKFRRK